jgi:hypothetical protein
MPRTLQNGQPSRATGRNEAKRKRLFVLVGPDLAKLFAEQSSPWSEKISELFAAQVEDAFTSRSLRSSLRKFYAEHIDFFRQERATARLTLQIDDLIAGLASTLSFRLIRTGNTSALFRLLTRYHAICEGLLKAPVPSHPEHIAAAKNALESLRNEPLPPARVVKQKKLGVPNTVKTIYSVSQSTARDIQYLVMQAQSKKMALLRNLIELAARKTETEKIKLFYSEHRERLERAGGRMVPMRLNLPLEIDTLHELLAAKLFDSDRMKSKALRVIVAYYARQR